MNIKLQIEESYSSLLLLEVTLDCMNASESHG